MRRCPVQPSTPLGPYQVNALHKIDVPIAVAGSRPLSGATAWFAPNPHQVGVSTALTGGRGGRSFWLKKLHLLPLAFVCFIHHDSKTTFGRDEHQLNNGTDGPSQ
jgi:hypothetical protein